MFVDVMSALEENYSENEDDPEVYESSGDEWSSSSDVSKKRSSRRASQRLSKKPRVTHVDSDTSDSDSEDSKPKSRNGVNKRQRVSAKPNATTPVSKKNPPPGSNIVPTTDFVNGSFLILKKDVQTGDSSNNLCIWRIDGKALLQKYEPFEEDGKTRHRNTSIYTGWSALDKDLYAPITVKVHLHSNQQMVVELDWDKVKEINMDSD